MGRSNGNRGWPDSQTSRWPNWIAGLFALATLCVAGSDTARAGSHIWNTVPADYQRIDPVAAADHVITYQIDLVGFNLFGGKNLSAEQVAGLSDAIRQAFADWNRAIEPIGLQFVEAAGAEDVELAVRALPYDIIDLPGMASDSIAVSLGWPFRHVYVVLPIWFDTAENLADLRAAPAVADRLLSQPYVRLIAGEQYDIYSVALHEIGHVLGLAHVADAIRGGVNYNFLGMSTVCLDAACLRPSTWVGGLETRARRPVLETELPTTMIPIRRATISNCIPPDDLATAAFLLRHLNPAGADQVLQQARTLYEQTSPLRFANVRYELEKNADFQRNASVESAMPVEPNQVILGSLFGLDKDGGERDKDCYQLDLSAWPVGTRLVLDIDEAGGLLDNGATSIDLQLLDAQGNLVAIGHPAGDPDPDSYDGADPLLDTFLPVPGVYYILVQQPDDASAGTYVLKIGVGGPVEPAGDAHPTIDDTGSAGCPEITPQASACPWLGFSMLTLSVSVLGMFSLWPGRSPR